MSANHAIIQADGRRQARGAITCAVRLTNAVGAEDPQLYVISCLHVLALAQEYYPEFPEGAVVLSGTNPVAETTGHLGFLLDRYCYSFDAAIARVTDESLIQQVLPEVRPAAYALNEKILPTDALIHVPGGSPLAVHSPRLRFGGSVSIPYEARSTLNSIAIWHRNIVEWTFQGSATVAGHSGSPVLSPSGDRLLGMHIAGSERCAYMIPAWDLLEAGNYYGLSRSRPMRLAGV